MDELVEEFQHLLNQHQGQEITGSIELVLQQMYPDSAKLLRLCSIPHYFDPSILQVLKPGMAPNEARKRCAEFSGLSIIIEHHDALVMHDDARRYLFSIWLGTNNTPEFASASTRLVEHFEKLMQEVSGESLIQTERMKMFHLLGAYQNKGFKEFEQLFRKMRHQFRLNDCESLIDLAHEYDRVLTPEHALGLAYNEGKLASDLRQWTKAEQLFNSIIEKTLDLMLHAKIFNRLGIIHAEQRNWNKAIFYYQHALETTKSMANTGDLIYRILNNLGAVYRDRGDIADAEKYLVDSIRLARQKGDLSGIAIGYNSLGTLYSKADDPRKAIESFEKSLENLKSGDDQFRPAQVYNNLGMVYANMNEWKESEQYFQKSLEIKRQARDTFGQAMTLNNLVQVYQNLGLNERAIQVSQQAIILFAEIHESYNVALAKNNLGKLYRNIHEIESSQQAFTEAIDLFKQCNEHNKADAAQKELAALTRKSITPKWMSRLFFYISTTFSIACLTIFFLIIIYSLIHVYFYKEQDDMTTIDDYTKSIESNFQDYEAYRSRGDEYTKLKQYDKAIADYTKAIEIEPEYYITYASRGLSYGYLKQYDKAIADYTKAIEIEPKYEYFNTRGILQFCLKQDEQAVVDYTKAVNIYRRSR